MISPNIQKQNLSEKSQNGTPQIVKELEEDSQQLSKTTVAKKLEKALLDPNEELLKEASILYISEVSYGTKGNISLITGKAKARKSMFLAMWIAGILGSQEIDPFQTAVSSATGILFDTEQSKRHSQLQYRRIMTLLGNAPKSGLKYYMLRPYSPQERLEMIKEEIYSNDKISFVVIDGIADLLSKGVNDEEEAIMVTGLLMKWSLERDIHIVTVLHQNKGDSNAKGHVGSQLVQKSETVLSIERDPRQNEVSVVSSPYARGLEINELHFSINDNGIPYIIEDFDSSLPKQYSKNPDDYEEEHNWEIITEVFKSGKEFQRKIFLGKIKQELKHKEIEAGEKKLREWINYFKNKGMITQEGNQKPYRLNSQWQEVG